MFDHRDMDDREGRVGAPGSDDRLRDNSGDDQVAPRPIPTPETAAPPSEHPSARVPAQAPSDSEAHTIVPTSTAAAHDTRKLSDFTEDGAVQEVVARLKGHSPALVEELHGKLLAQFIAEEERGKSLDTKAISMLTISGLSLTVAFSFGATVLVREPASFEGIGNCGYRGLVALFAVALALGIFAGSQALRALLVQNFKALDFDDLLSRQVLDRADSADREASESSHGDLSGEAGLTVYRRYVAAHAWRVTLQNTSFLNKKAAAIQRGQISFFLFLGVILLMGIACAAAAWTRGIPKAAATPATTISPPETAVVTKDLPAGVVTSLPALDPAASTQLVKATAAAAPAKSITTPLVRNPPSTSDSGISEDK